MAATQPPASREQLSSRRFWSTGFSIAGYTHWQGQVDFSELPADLAKRRPRRVLPVAIWLAGSDEVTRRGLEAADGAGLRDCYEAGQTFAFIAVILDC